VTAPTYEWRTSETEVTTPQPTAAAEVDTPDTRSGHQAAAEVDTRPAGSPAGSTRSASADGGAHPEVVTPLAYGAHLSPDAGHQEHDHMDSDNQEPRTSKKQLQLSRGEKALGVLAVLAASVAGGFGFAQSFEAVSAWGQQAGFLHGWMLPLTVDLLIPAFGILSCLLIRLGMEYKPLRWAPLAMTVATVYLNTNTGHVLAYKIAHGLTAGVFALVTEVGMHYYRYKSGVETGTRMGRVRPARWVLSPWPTFKVWRRMVLWEIRDYELAIQLELNRQLAVADLEEEYGKDWKKKAPRRVLVGLNLGLTPQQAQAATTAPQQAVEPVETVPAIEAPAPVDTATQERLAELTELVRTLTAQVSTATEPAPVEVVTQHQPIAYPTQWAPAIEQPAAHWAPSGDHLSGHQVTAIAAEVITEPVTPLAEVDTPAEEVTTEPRAELDEGARRWFEQSLSAARRAPEQASVPAQVTTPQHEVTDWVAAERVAEVELPLGLDEVEEDTVEPQAGEDEINAEERIRRIREVKGTTSQRKAAEYAQCTPTYVRKVWAAMDEEAGAEEAATLIDA